MLGLCLLSLAQSACGPSVDVAVMAMGPKFPPRPANCEIAFVVEDPTTVNLSYHIVATIMVNGFDQGGRTLSNEITPELRNVLRPAACEMGADTVSPGMSFAAMQMGGTASNVTFYILKKRDQPLQVPPGMMPPGMTPPAQQPQPAPSAPAEPPPDTKAL